MLIYNPEMIVKVTEAKISDTVEFYLARKMFEKALETV